MKQIFIRILIPAIVLNTSASRAETVLENVAQLRDWSGVVLEDHRITGQGARMASTTNDAGARLEMYAEKSVREGFVAPIVQVAFESETLPIGGEIVFDRRERFAMTADLSQVTEGQRSWRLIAPLSDRSRVVSTIRRRNRAVLTVHLKGGETQTLNFSLSGSTHTIGETF